MNFDDLNTIKCAYNFLTAKFVPRTNFLEIKDNLLDETELQIVSYILDSIRFSRYKIHVALYVLAKDDIDGSNQNIRECGEVERVFRSQNAEAVNFGARSRRLVSHADIECVATPAFLLPLPLEKVFSTTSIKRFIFFMGCYLNSLSNTDGELESESDDHDDGIRSVFDR